MARGVSPALPVLSCVTDWTRQQAQFCKAVGTENMVMFICLSLFVGVAAFNIVSTLVMVVQDKQADIAILRTLGATPRSIMAIFMVQGTIIGVVGTVIGVGLGSLLAYFLPDILQWVQQAFGVSFLSAQVYYISDLPSELKLADVSKIGALSLMLGLLSTLYPAYRASRTLPAEALRYE